MTVSVNGTTGITFNDASTQNTAATGFGFKNRIINGAMMIDQRNAGASVTPSATASNVYTLDRWAYFQSQASKFAVQQNAGSVTPPTGFTNYIGLTSQSAYSVVSSDYFGLAQIIEGFNTSDLAWGTANAQTVTLSFRVYSSLTGTFGGSIQNAAQTRSYPFTYTISSANTWTSVSITIAGDTSGTWVGASSSGSIRINFGLGMGSTFSGTAGAWASANSISATGATSVVGTNGATFYITGVQLEKGSTATSFDYRPYGTELALCQRYCQTSFSNATSVYQRYASGQIITGSTAEVYFQLKATMRTTPSLTTTGTSGNYVIYSGNTVYSLSGIPSITTVISNNEFVGSQISTSGGMTGGYACSLNSNNLSNTYIWLTAEL
jgi:hypothetical protein